MMLLQSLKSSAVRHRADGLPVSMTTHIVKKVNDCFSNYFLLSGAFSGYRWKNNFVFRQRKTSEEP
jgi:hypothetical protein